MPSDCNFYTALRAGFPADLDATALTLPDRAGGAPLRYTWADLDHGSAMMANLLASLDLPPSSLVAVAAAEPCAEAVMLWWAVLRAGHVYRPPDGLRTPGTQGPAVDATAVPAVVVCAPRDFAAVSRRAFAVGVQQVYTLDGDRGGTLLARSAPQSAVHAVVPCGGDAVAVLVRAGGLIGRDDGAHSTHPVHVVRPMLLTDPTDLTDPTHLTPLTHGQLMTALASVPSPHVPAAALHRFVAGAALLPFDVPGT